MPPRLNDALFRQLLSRSNTIEIFNQCVKQLLINPRPVDGVLRTETQIIQSFSPWSKRMAEASLNKSRPGDSAVIVPLVEVNEQPWIIFTHRSYQLRSHRGEVSFPGGKIDTDETIEQAAMREVTEEIGLKTEDIRLWGRLPSMFTRYNENVITPVVGQVNEVALKRLTIGTDEVQSAPLQEFVDKNYTAFRVGFRLYWMPVYQTRHYKFLTKHRNAYEHPDKTYKIWGLTGRILNELLATLLPSTSYEYVP